MATPFEWGPEFLVNTTTALNQDTPTITALADGRFVVAWTDFSQTGADTSGYAVRAQMLSADGSAFGTEFLVNSTTANVQRDPTITALADGRFVVAWSDHSASGGDTDGTAVRAQLFNADGSALATEFLVNTTTSAEQFQPTITALADGRFVVAWTDSSQTGGDTAFYSVRAQLFNPDGSVSGAEFVVNTTTAFNQFQPTIAALAGGRFVVAWTDGSQTGGDTSGTAIRAQVFNANGSTFGTEFLVNTAAFRDQDLPAITGLADGRFVVTWKDGSDLNGYSVRAQIFNADGSTSGAEFLVNTTTDRDQTQPTTTALADGRFVMAWVDTSLLVGNPFGAAIVAQLFNANGSTSGAEFLVSTGNISGQYPPTITALADGRFAVAWTDASMTGGDTSGSAIRAQIFDPREAAVVLSGTALNDDYVGTGFGDQMSGGFGSDTLTGAAGADTLFGADGNDRLFGGAGTDTLMGGAGLDSLFGGSSLDYLNGHAGNDRLYGGAAADWLRGGADHDRLFAEAGNDQLFGEAGNDWLYGGQGIDWLFGGADNDQLFGGTDNDRLTGGTGIDRMAGGGGADVFVFATAAEAGTFAVHDLISDFTAGSDRLDLSAIQAGQTFIGAAGFGNVAGQVRYDVASGLLRGDLDGDGAADYVIELTNLAAITAGDLIL